MNVFLFINKILAPIDCGELCPVCKNNTAEYWANGKVKKYKNNSCSSKCWKNSEEFLLGKSAHSDGRRYKAAKLAEDRRELERYSSQNRRGATISFVDRDIKILKKEETEPSS